MSGLVVDTHAIVWYLADDPRLSAKAASALDAVSSGGSLIYVPSICLVEVMYLVEKNRLPEVARRRLLRSLDDPQTPFSLVPLDRMIADAMAFVRRDEIPDMPDRVIAATALALRLPLVSCDRKVQASKVPTLW